jgi:RNA polymerase sigma-70 factor, ECF subfamily
MLIQVELSDDELCRRIAERDADAFELMVDRHQAHAYRLAYSILGNEADARDVSQDAFIRLYEAAGDRSDDASNAQCIDARGLHALRNAIDDSRSRTIDA